VIDELMAEGVNVALPVVACDIDLLAFMESRTEPCGVVPVPIQIVVSREDGLARHLETARAFGVLVALIWDAAERVPIRSFALTSAELTLVRMIDRMSAAGAARTSASADPGRPQPLATEG
jgi:hypothetical protein